MYDLGRRELAGHECGGRGLGGDVINTTSTVVTRRRNDDYRSHNYLYNLTTALSSGPSQLVVLFPDFTHVLISWRVTNTAQWRENKEDMDEGGWMRWQPRRGRPCAAPGAPVAPWNVRGWVSVS